MTSPAAGPGKPGHGRRRTSPVIVTWQPVTRCDLCGRPVTYQPGRASEALTAHYTKEHLEDLARAGILT
ncbi:MAG: hypothetical protein ACRDPY_33840 [Streptosporangiaceae bacterium]